MTIWAMLLLWPVVTIIFYRKLRLPVALLATVLGGYLLLPQAELIDLPVLPRLDRVTIPVLMALIMTAIVLAKDDHGYQVLPGWIPRDPVVIGLLAMLFVGVFMTVATNGDTLVYGDRVIEGAKLYDAFAICLDLLLIFLPFLLARRVLASAEGQKVLLLAIALSALCYTPLVLYEVRMSPQLHTTFYGFFPHSFAQHMRGGGFRPIVFLDHGLSLAIFLASSVLAAVGLFRIARHDARLQWACVVAWLMLVLVLCKSLGALLITIVLLPVALFFKPRMQLTFAACVAGVVMIYPMLRAVELVPLNQLLAFVENINPARADSLLTRVENEEALLDKAKERPLFGWSSWGRNRIYDDEGVNLSITDGTWIIQLGEGGWFRYIPFFGLLCWPIIASFLSRRHKPDLLCSVLALILCAKLVDLIPNSGVPAIYWFIAGSLMGRLEMRQGREAPASAAGKPLQKAGYARGAPPPDTNTPAEGSRYARSFPEQEARRGAKTKPIRDARPGRSYKRSDPSTGYRK